MESTYYVPVIITGIMNTMNKTSWALIKLLSVRQSASSSPSLSVSPTPTLLYTHFIKLKGPRPKKQKILVLGITKIQLRA